MKYPAFDPRIHGGDQLAAYLKTIVDQAILLERTPCDQEPALGTSKIGGVPHLPTGFQWPYFEGKDWEGVRTNRPLSFLAQIDLKAANALDDKHRLPEQGYLYFFYEVVSQPWGFDPQDRGCARVYYFDVPAQELQETTPPQDLSREARIPLSLLSFRTMEDLPDYEEFCEATGVEAFRGDLDWEVYDEMRAQTIELLDVYPEDFCKLLGYADLIQGPIGSQCARIAAGLYCGNPEAYQNTTQAQKAAIAADSPNWVLLAQFGTLSDSVMFGDCGCIYFYIHQEDLAQRRFDQVWLCLQCG